VLLVSGSITLALTAKFRIRVLPIRDYALASDPTARKNERCGPCPSAISASASAQSFDGRSNPGVPTS
jgi:hypothetical protein